MIRFFCLRTRACLLAAFLTAVSPVLSAPAGRQVQPGSLHETKTSARYLDLSGTLLTPSDPELLASFTHLESLDLTACSGVKEIILPPLPELKSLTLKACKTLTTLILPELPNLQHLDLRWCDNLVTFSHPHLPRLLSLRMNDCLKMTGTELIGLSSLVYLQHLDLSGWDLHDGDLAHLVGLNHLQTLSLGGCRELTAEGVLQLANLQELRKLDLGKCTGLTDLTLPDLAHLETLILAGCTNLTSLSPGNHPRLKSLHLEGCHKLMATALDQLKNFRKLTYLHLEGCHGITDAMIKNLQQGSHLELPGKLMIYYTKSSAVYQDQP